MGSFINFGWGVQNILNGQMNFVRNAHPVFLRLKNFADSQTQSWSALGFAISPSGQPSTAVIDYPIIPRPGMRMLPMTNKGIQLGKLRVGARTFIVSGTFVDNQKKKLGITNQDLVWRGPNVLGLVTDNQLFEIVDYTHEELGGKTVIWNLLCNGPETKGYGQ